MLLKEHPNWPGSKFPIGDMGTLKRAVLVGPDQIGPALLADICFLMI
jgi:hypothetical protein